MVAFDNSIFCLTLHPDAKPRSTVDRAKDRIEHLLETLRNDGETAIVPAPVLSEFLVFAGKDAPDYLLKIRESSTLRIEPFDERAAIELADLEISARAKGNKRGSGDPKEEWQKVKFDRQIVAIAKVHRVSILYSDDPDVAMHGKDAGVKVLALADLPLPPSKQITFAEVLSEQETATNKAAQPIPPPVSGSPEGSTDGEARTKAAKAEDEAGCE